MKDEDFKKWVCKKAVINFNNKLFDWDWDKTEALIKAMFALVDDGAFFRMNDIFLAFKYKNDESEWVYSDYNNSKSEALEAALRYIADKENK